MSCTRQICVRSNGHLCRWRSSPSPPCVNPHHVAGCYRPQRSCGKVMFLHLSVSHSVHEGVSASVHAGIHPPADTPPGSYKHTHTPLAATHTPGRYTPLPGRYPNTCNRGSCAPVLELEFRNCELKNSF